MDLQQGAGPMRVQLLASLVLPNTTSDEKIKIAVLELALERAQKATDAGLNSEAQALLEDVDLELQESPDHFAYRNPSPSHVPTTFTDSLICSSADNNPYLKDMVTEATADLTKEDIPWDWATQSSPPVFNGHDGPYGVRSTPKLIQNYFWLFSHHQSPLAFNPQLLKRALRRAHAYVDLLILYPHHEDKEAIWFDQFSVANAFAALYIIVELYPNLLTESQRARWDAAMSAIEADSQTWTVRKRNYKTRNYNIDTARMIGVMNIGLYQKDSNITSEMETHIQRVLAKQLPDGAFHYHDLGEPSCNYHNEMLELLLMVYEQMDKSQPIKDALISSQWKGPVMGRTDEFWTSPFFKTFRWNYEHGTEAGPEAVATFSQNPYVIGLHNRDRLPNFTSSGNPLKGLHHVAYYDPNLQSLAKDLPDQYTIPDRNVGGARAWYGEFNYATNFKTNFNDSGKRIEGRETLMGAMTVDAADGRLNSILTDVTPRVIMKEGDANHSHIGKLTYNESSATTISRHYSIGSSIHEITDVHKDAYSGKLSGWTGRQLWIGLPDRIIGMVSTVPTSGRAKAHAINGVLRLISGGTAGARITKKLEVVNSDDTTHYRYGQLEILVHDHNYTSLSGFEVKYRRDKYPATELTFSDRATEPLPRGDLNTYPPNTEYYFVVEIRPSWASSTELSHVSSAKDTKEGVIGMEVIGNKRSFAIWLNVSESKRKANLNRKALPAGRDSIVHSNGVLGRSTFSEEVPATTTLQPGQHVALVVSDEACDHDNGWESLQEMLESC